MNMAYIIQIQHLLKLNATNCGGNNPKNQIQIQHLLKLNERICRYKLNENLFKYNTC